MMRTPLFSIVLLAFVVTSVIGPMPVYANEINLPKPGVMVHLSPEFNPPVLKGVTVHPDNPFKFDFILDKGDSSVIARSEATKQSQQEQLKTESTKLVKYFLSAITTPEKDLWVNLSPYEKNRIIPESFGQTAMGRDLLAQDYILKQITASLIYPEEEIGKQFWKRVYEEAQKRFGTTNIPVNTFNKVWIVPEHAKVYEHNNTAYVVNARLKVLLEQDYLSLDKNTLSSRGDEVAVAISKGTSNEEIASPTKQARNDINDLGSQIVREIVIPQLEKEVNENKNFAQLRQVYHSLILAVWFKKRMKDSLLGRKYMDQNKVTGIHYENTVIARSEATKQSQQEQSDTEAIYQRYLQAFKKGVYNYIKEDVIASPEGVKQSIPRKYFSGGAQMSQAMITTDFVQTMDPAEISDAMWKQEDFVTVAVDLTDKIPSASTANQDSARPNDFFRGSMYLDLGEGIDLRSLQRYPWEKGMTIKAFHGKAQRNSVNVANSPNLAEETIGSGLYLTTKAEAEGYARIRAITADEPVVDQYEVKGLKLFYIPLDFPETVFQEWIGFLDEKYVQLLADATWYVREKIEQTITQLRSKKPAAVKNVVNGHDKYFSEFLIKKGYDGVVASEGGEGVIGNHLTIVIFDRTKPKLLESTPINSVPAPVSKAMSSAPVKQQLFDALVSFDDIYGGNPELSGKIAALRLIMRKLTDQDWKLLNSITGIIVDQLDAANNVVDEEGLFDADIERLQNLLVAGVALLTKLYAQGILTEENIPLLGQSKLKREDSNVDLQVRIGDMGLLLIDKYLEPYQEDDINVLLSEWSREVFPRRNNLKDLLAYFDTKAKDIKHGKLAEQRLEFRRRVAQIIGIKDERQIILVDKTRDLAWLLGDDLDSEDAGFSDKLKDEDGNVVPIAVVRCERGDLEYLTTLVHESSHMQQSENASKVYGEGEFYRATMEGFQTFREYWILQQMIVEETPERQFIEQIIGDKFRELMKGQQIKEDNRLRYRSYKLYEVLRRSTGYVYEYRFVSRMAKYFLPDLEYPMMGGGGKNPALANVFLEGDSQQMRSDLGANRFEALHYLLNNLNIKRIAMYRLNNARHIVYYMAAELLLQPGNRADIPSEWVVKIKEFVDIVNGELEPNKKRNRMDPHIGDTSDPVEFKAVVDSLSSLLSSYVKQEKDEVVVRAGIAELKEKALKYKPMQRGGPARSSAMTSSSQAMMVAQAKGMLRKSFLDFLGKIYPPYRESVLLQRQWARKQLLLMRAEVKPEDWDYSRIRIIDEILSKENLDNSDDLLDQIPMGSTYLGNGEFALVLNTPQGDVLRFGSERRRRPNIKGVLQPTSYQKIGKFHVERLVKVRTNDPTKDKTKAETIITDAKRQQLNEVLDKQGFVLTDSSDRNLGVLPSGEAVVVDAGAVDLKEDKDNRSASYRSVEDMKGFFEFYKDKYYFIFHYGFNEKARQALRLPFKVGSSNSSKVLTIVESPEDFYNDLDKLNDSKLEDKRAILVLAFPKSELGSGLSKAEVEKVIISKFTDAKGVVVPIQNIYGYIAAKRSSFSLSFNKGFATSPARNAQEDKAVTVQEASAPGGIDLTADRMKVDIESDKALVSQPMDLKALESIEINALYIKDLEIKPLNNLPELLGIH